MSSDPSLARVDMLRANHYGQTLSGRTIGALTLVDKRYSPHTSLASHFHEQAGLYFVRSGEAEETVGRRVQRLVRGSLWFRPAGELHENRVGSVGVRCLVIDLSDQWLKYVRSCAPFPDEPSFRFDTQVSSLGARLCQEFSMQRPPSGLAVEGLLLELAACLCHDPTRSSSGQRPSWLSKAIEFLHSCFKDDIHLSLLAELVEVHPVHLARVFRKHHGCTVGTYVQRLRVEFACERLADAKASISEIALDAGFANQAHFSRVFKLITGTSPAQYRAVFSQR